MTLALSTLATSGVTAWWFGLNDITVEGTYTYTDGTPFDYLMWAAGYPRGTSLDVLDCVFNSASGARDFSCTAFGPYCCQTTACSAVTVTLTAAAGVTVPTFATVVDGVVTFLPTVTADVGTWVFFVTRTDSSGNVRSVDTVTLTVTDSCTTASLALATTLFKQIPTSSLDYSVGGDRAALSWTDSLVTLTPTAVCGAYTVTYTKDGSSLTTESTQPFSLDASNNLSVFTTSSGLVGAHTFTVTVALTNYPTITTSADFLVNIVAVETTMTAAFIPPFTYTIEGAVDDIKFEEFTFTTTDGNEDAYVITYEATLATDDTDTSSD